MISAKEAAALPAAKLAPDEESAVATVLSRLDEAVKQNFDGLGAFLTVPVNHGGVTARAMAEAVRRVTAPQPDGSRWYATLAFNFARGPALVEGGKPQVALLSYTLTVAVDAGAETILRVRKETTQ